MSSRRKFIRSAALLPLLPSLELSDLITTQEPSIIKPPALQPGDAIAVASPAGAVWDEKQVSSFTNILQQLGFKVKACKSLKEKFGYFSGTDEARAKELNELFADKTVNGIFCMKGGWGCARILDKLDYASIRNNPKVIMGFSDITSLLIAIHAKTGLVTFHGPVGNSGWNEFSVSYVRSILMKKEAASLLPGPSEADKPLVIRSGTAKGALIGGNLSVLASVVGSTFLPSFKDKLLFLEETKEEPYRIDRMLTQLNLAGILGSVSGVIFGKCVKCEAEEPEKAFTFQQVLEQHLKPLNVPVFYGGMTGHIENKWTLPIGLQAKMDAGKGEVELLGSAVS